MGKIQVMSPPVYSRWKNKLGGVGCSRCEKPIGVWDEYVTKTCTNQTPMRLYCVDCGNLVKHQIQNITRKNIRETIKKIVKIPIPRKVWRMLDYGVG